MQTLQPPLDVGADVSKNQIVVACAEQSFTTRSIANTRAALLSWLKQLPAGSRVGMESTGTYHELLAELAHKLGLIVYLLNTKDVRHYAKGVGLRGKTDRVDAQLIARFVAKEHTKLHPWLPATREQRQLERLLKRRAMLSRTKAALSQSLKGLSGCSTQLKALVGRLDALIGYIDARIDTLIQAHPARREGYARLQSIAGVGPVVGSALVSALQRRCFERADAFVAFCGWDPCAHDSGHKRGRRRLSKRGPSELRRLLYNAAMSASRTKTWKPRYQRERAKGLSRTAALVALARHITRTAWSIYTHNTTFDPDRINHGLT
jgi:transposase